MKPALRATVVATAVALAPAASIASCGSAFCFVNTNWSLQGIWTQPGPHFDLRYEYIDQDQPMAGSNKVSVGEIPRHHDEVSTLNQNLSLRSTTAFTPEWGATIVVPIVDRDHEHIHNHQGEQLPDQWDFTELGDIRVQGRWQTLIGETTAERAGFAGVTFGLTLPTGKTDVTNGEGEVAERSLQPGTGTTQLALSALFPRSAADAQFVVVRAGGRAAAAQLPRQLQAGQSVRSRLGLPLRRSDDLGLNLQLNYVYKGRRQRRRGRARGFRRPDGRAHARDHLRVHAGRAGIRVRATADLPVRQRRAAHRKVVRHGGLSAQF